MHLPVHFAQAVVDPVAEEGDARLQVHHPGRQRLERRVGVLLPGLSKKKQQTQNKTKNEREKRVSVGAFCVYVYP